MSNLQRFFLVVAGAAVGVLVVLFVSVFNHNGFKPPAKPNASFPQLNKLHEGWSVQGADVRLDGTKTMPLYGEPNPNGLRDGMSMYLPAGEYEMDIHVGYEIAKGEIKFSVDLGDATFRSDGEGGQPYFIVGSESLKAERRFPSLKCAKPIGWCEILVSAESTAPATVYSWSRMYVRQIPKKPIACPPPAEMETIDGKPVCAEGIEVVGCNPPGNATLVNGKMVCAFYLDGNYGAQ